MILTFMKWGPDFHLLILKLNLYQERANKHTWYPGKGSTDSLQLRFVYEFTLIYILPYSRKKNN